MEWRRLSLLTPRERSRTWSKSLLLLEHVLHNTIHISKRTLSIGSPRSRGQQTHVSSLTPWTPPVTLYHPDGVPPVAIDAGSEDPPRHSATETNLKPFACRDGRAVSQRLQLELPPTGYLRTRRICTTVGINATVSGWVSRFRARCPSGPSNCPAKGPPSTAPSVPSA